VPPSIIPEAVFDSLVLTEHLDRIAGDATRGEVVTLAYLGCLLSRFSGSTSLDWGYGFVVTSYAAPYSESLVGVIDALIVRGLIYERGDAITLSDAGRSDLVGISHLDRFSPRKRYLDAAAMSAVLIPLPEATSSISFEPQIRRATELQSVRMLFDEASDDEIDRQFVALRSAVSDPSDLLSASLVWLNYLSRSQSLKEDATQTASGL
jgi:hypothetical protein